MRHRIFSDPKYYIFCFVLGSLLLLTGSFNTSSAQTPPDMGVPLNPEISGDVEFWHFWSSPVRRTAIRRIVAMCQQALPQVVVTEVFKPFGDIWTANVAAVAAGAGMPDVIVEDRPQLARIAAEGIQTNLQPYIDRDGIDPARFWEFTWDQTLYDGASYGIPFETDVRVLFYNKTLFAQAGLDPERPPETWEEVWQYADQLDRINADGTIERIGFFPLIKLGPDVWAQTNGQTWIGEDGRPQINTEAFIGTLDWVNQWIGRYGGWSAIQEFRANFAAAPNDEFMTGRVAMIADIGGYSSILNFYRPRITLDDGSQAEIDWGIALLPYNVAPSSVSGGFTLSIPTGADQADAAWEFIKCATSPVAQVSWARDTYSMPSDISAANDPVLMADPKWAFLVQAMETSSTTPFFTPYPNWREQLDQRYERIWTGEIRPQQAAEEAQQAVEEISAQNP